MRLRPFFPFYGSKWLLARHYPAPAFDHIVEPFAGSASYAVNYSDRRVTLVDSDPRVVALWRYLIRVKPSELMAIPATARHASEVPGPDEARLLVGMWFGRATAMCGVRKSMSKWGREEKWPTSFWGPSIQARLARQVDHIRHWKAAEGDYTSADRGRATYFVDPPYQVAGKHYRSDALGYRAIGLWAASLPGQVIVCEAAGATWLPFEPFRTARANSSRGTGRVSHEVIWTNGIARSASHSR